MNDLYCDRCGAIAKSRFLFPNGTDIIFCGHHTREYSSITEVAVEDPTFNSNDQELMEV